MKPFIKPSFVALAFSLIAFTACNKNSADTTPAQNNNNSSSTVFTSGKYTITSYTQRTENKTDQFAGIVFTFSDNGTVSATSNGTATAGTWAYSPSTVGYYGGEASIASVALSLGTLAPLNRLNRRWNITSSSAKTVALVNPEPNEDEHITFTKQ